MGMMQAQMMRHFSSDANSSNENARIIKEEGEEPMQNTIFEQAQIGQNVHPAQFEKEKVMSNIDPDTMLKKNQNLEYQDVPKDGKHNESQYHVMKSLEPFKSTDNDISKEYGLKVKGLEPTRFGDWERKGRCTDF